MAAFTNGRVSKTFTGTGTDGPHYPPVGSKTFALATVTTGGPSAISIKLQGTVDGTIWTDLLTSTSTTGDTQWAVDKPVTAIRFNLGTMTGGTNITAYCVASG